MPLGFEGAGGAAGAMAGLRQTIADRLFQEKQAQEIASAQNQDVNRTRTTGINQQLADLRGRTEDRLNQPEPDITQNPIIRSTVQRLNAEKPGAGDFFLANIVAGVNPGQFAARPIDPTLVDTVNDAGENVKRAVIPKVGDEFRSQPKSAGVTVNTGGNGLSPIEASRERRELRNEWANLGGKALGISNFALAKMRGGLESSRAGDRIAGDQAILVTYQKMLDETSVVRESEYARSATGLALKDRVEGLMQQYLGEGGSGVPLNELNQFIRAAEIINQQVRESVEPARQLIEANATELEFDPRLIFSTDALGIPAFFKGSATDEAIDAALERAMGGR